MSALVEIKDVCKVYNPGENEVRALDHVSLTIDEQEFVAIIGHSGSGKSTVLDAIQIVLYANTDGRGFFNKAAADDSDRTLIEYLRGMVNISENNESQYLRNRNFSSTIVLELTQTNTRDKQCVGVVFDVDTSNNDVSRLFFWHTGELLPNHYRSEGRCLTTAEMREYLQRSFTPEQFYCGPSNERFRRQLYDIYLGGLDMEKFPKLFKRAISFRMNIKLEDFVKEYICMEQDIHIEDLQESVMQYGRMQKKIEDTCEEIRQLKAMKEAFNEYDLLREKQEKYSWFVKKLDLLDTRAKICMFSDKIDQGKEDLDRLGEAKRLVERQIADLTKDSDELLKRIASTGYEELKEQLSSLNALCEQLGHSEAKWQKTLNALKKWEEEEIVSNQTLWDIEEFENRSIDKAALRRLKASLSSMEADTEKLRKETASQINELKKAEKRKSEVDTLFARMYEDWAAGRITEYNFSMLSGKYQSEQAELDEKIEQLQSAIATESQNAADAEKWIALMKECVNPTELTAELLNMLIEKIVVHEAVKGEDGSREQEVEIFYRFIGKID